MEINNVPKMNNNILAVQSKVVLYQQVPFKQ